MSKEMCNYFYVCKSGGGRYQESGVMMLDTNSQTAFNELIELLCGSHSIVITTFHKV